MKRGVWIAVVGVLAGAACEEGEEPTGAVAPRLEFAVSAPTRLESKAVIDVAVRITRAEGIERPIVVLIEKSNDREPFFGVARIELVGATETSATTRVPVLYDPRIRVTVSESSALALSVSQTISVDVLDYP